MSVYLTGLAGGDSGQKAGLGAVDSDGRDVLLARGRGNGLHGRSLHFLVQRLETQQTGSG